jgi:hypothetical protein
VEASRGGGHVVVCAVDPAAAPLATWPGAPALVGRLLAPAYQGNYYGGTASLSSSSGPLGVPTSAGPQAPTAAGLMSSAAAGAALAPYVEQMPGASLPSAGFLGLLCLGYVVVAGPACFIVLGRLKRREMLWVVLPCLAVLTGLLSYITGAGMGNNPLADEIQVAVMAPGANFAQVSSLGAVYLPRGGSSQVTLSSSGPVSDLGAFAGALLTVGPGTAPGTSGLTVSGPNNSLGGWATSEEVSVRGTVEASTRTTGQGVSGRVTNNLGAQLTSVYVVSSTGQVSQPIGTLRPGSSASFNLPAPSASMPENPLFSAYDLTGAAARHQALLQGLYQLAAQYSDAGTTGPVLMGLASTPLLARDTVAGGTATKVTDAVVVPMWPTAASPTVLPELVGSHGATTGGTSTGTGTVSLVLGKGGFFDYQFLLANSRLPTGRPAKLELDLGSPTGSPAGSGAAVAGLGVSSQSGGTSGVGSGDFAVSAFDYATGAWGPLRTSVSTGHLTATITGPTYVGPGGAVEVRLSALTPSLQVFGSVPTLAAVPGQP